MALTGSIPFLFAQRWVFLIVSIFCASTLLYIAFRPERDISGWPSKAFNSWNHHQDNDRFTSLDITGLFQIPRLPVDAENFTDPAGKIYSLPYFSPQKPEVTKSLGKEILILDADTRPMDGPGELLNSTSPNRLKAWHTFGRLNHYLFAKIHGYDYKFMHVQQSQERQPTWCKVPAMREQLQNYKFVVFVDADTIFPYLHLPLEWLFNYWNINPETLIALARDPEDPINNDDRGRTYLNTGFVIAQQSPRTEELFKAWDECSNGIQYPSCVRWTYNWPHEQAAFGSHIRYDFNRSQDVKVLSCAEANGCPEAAHMGCMGRLVRHYWYGKTLVPAAVRESFLQLFVPPLHELFLQEYGLVAE